MNDDNLSQKNDEAEKNQNQRRLLSSSSLVSVMTLLSRVMGLVRDVLIAQMLGAGTNADAFFVAFKVPNFLRRLFAEGAFSQAFVPVLSEYKIKGKDEVRALLRPVLGTLGGATFLLCVVAAIFAPYVVWLVAPGFSDTPDKMAMTSDMMRITFPYLFFVSLMACASGVLNTYRIFAPTAFSPVLLNLCMIGALLVAAPIMFEPAMALACAVALAGLLQLLLHLYFLARINVLVWPSFNWRHSGVIKILTLMTPAVFGVSVSQINLLLDTILASFLINGSVSWLYYADRLVELPLGVFGIAIATVILPHLSSQHVALSVKGFAATLDWAFRWVITLGVPAAMAMIVLAQPILITLFFYGEFSLIDVKQSAAALQAYSLALLPFMLIKVLATGYFSRQDTKTPVKIGILAMVVNMIANLALVWNFAHVGLALATGLSASLNAGLLYRGLARQGVFKLSKETFIFLLKVFAGSTIMVVVLHVLNLQLEAWVGLQFWQRILWLSFIIFAGLTTFFLSLWCMGLRISHLREPDDEIPLVTAEGPPLPDETEKNEGKDK